MPITLTPEIIAAAIDGYEAQKLRIDARLAELRTMQSSRAAQPGATPGSPKPQRRKMSAASRRVMALAQQKRWAAIRAAKELERKEQAAPETVKPKRAATKRTAAKKTAPVAVPVVTETEGQ